MSVQLIGMITAFVAGAFVAAVAAVVAWARGRGRRRKSVARANGVAYERAGDQGASPRGVRASRLNSLRDADDPNERNDVRERELGDDLRGYLGDLAAQHGADDAMFWLIGPEQGPFVPVAWNHPGLPPASPWGTAHQRALITWAAVEGVVSFDSMGDASLLGAARVSLDEIAPLAASGQTVGTLVLHSAGGIRATRGDLKLWLPRQAERLAQLMEFQVTRNETARQNRRMRVLVRTVRELDPSDEKHALERRIAEDMLEVSGATFAALVDWRAGTRRGSVRYASSAYPDPQPVVGEAVMPESLVGGVCLDGAPRLWDDAGAIASSADLYAPGAKVPRVGTLAILPMRRHKSIIGAIVIGASEAGMLRQSDLKTAGFFAQLAGSALEAAWELEEVSRSARIDQLTGLGNRRHFDEELKRAFDQTDRFGQSCALLLVDMDLFKVVNDTHGHLAGDKVLKTVAQVMREAVRNTDECARIGGEEFCVILPQTSEAGALELAERIRAQIAGLHISWRDHALRVTASIGLATYEAGGGPARRAQLFDAADRALYRAKRDGRNCVRMG